MAIFDMNSQGLKRRHCEEFEMNAKKSVVDYSGHIPEPTLRALPRQFEPALLREDPGKSPIKELIDEMFRKTNEAREELLRKLIEDPGIVATFNDNFVVEFGDFEFETIDSPEDRGLNEYRIAITQKWRIRRREEEDGRPGLGGDS